MLEVSLTVSLFETLGQCIWQFSFFKCEAFKTENLSSLLKVAALSGVYDCIVFVVDVMLVADSSFNSCLDCFCAEMLVLRI